MALVNLGISAFFGYDNNQRLGDERWKKFSLFLSKRLMKAADDLSEMGFPFEAGETEGLASSFADFSKGDDQDPEDFAQLWNELTEWAEHQVNTGRRDIALCKLPRLPDSYSC